MLNLEIQILQFSKFPRMESLIKDENPLLLRYEQLELALDLYCDFSKNEAFIIFIASKCCNFQEIKQEILTHEFSCDQGKINAFMKSNYFISQTQSLKRRCAQLKCQLKNQRLKWRVYEESQIQNILIKHIIKVLTFRTNRQLSIKFLKMELKNFKDPHLSKFFNLDMSYDWISFLVYVILKNNISNANILSPILQIPEEKLENFYKLRKLAISESPNQDSNRYRRLFLLWDSDQDRTRIRDQKQKLLVQLAIKKYGPKSITQQKIKIISNQIQYQETQQILYLGSANQLNRNISKLTKNYKNTYKQSKITQNHNLGLKQCDIYDSDDEIIQKKGSFMKDNFDISFFNDSSINIDRPYKCQIGSQLEKSKLYCSKLEVNLQMTVYSMNDPKQVQSQQTSADRKASINGFNRIIPLDIIQNFNSCSDFQRDKSINDKNFNEQDSERKNKLKLEQIISFNVQQETSMYLKIIDDNSQPEIEKKLSIEDEIILYFLYKMQGIEGITNTQAELILERSKQQLVSHFFLNNVVHRFEQIEPQIQKYILQYLNRTQNLNNQKYIYLISLIDKLSNKQQQTIQIRKSQQNQNSIQKADFRVIIGNLNEES